MSSRLNHLTQDLVGSFARFLLVSTTLISTIFLLVYYHDDGEFHDAGVYYESGLAVLRGDNPYVASRWGSFGPVPFSILVSIVPMEAQAAFVRILSFLGVYIFFRVFFPNNRRIEPMAISLVLLWLSPFRELLVTNQISGIAIGLIALGVKFLGPFSSFRALTLKALLGATFFAMALDLKPHICIFFFISWVIYHRSFSKFSIVALVLFVTHAVIDLSQMKILELEWMSTLRSLNESASQSALGDSLSFWPILNHFWPAPSLYYLLSIVVPLCLSAACFYWAYKGKWDVTFVLCFFIPATSSYFHYYDAVPLCVVFAVLLFRISNQLLITFSVSFILIPKEYLMLRNQLLVLFMIGLFSVREKMLHKEKKLWKILTIVFTGLAFSYLLRVFNTSLQLSSHLLQSLIVTQTLIIIMGLYCYAKLKKVLII
jgi:hypothetical protein